MIACAAFICYNTIALTKRNTEATKLTLTSGYDYSGKESVFRMTNK